MLPCQLCRHPAGMHSRIKQHKLFAANRTAPCVKSIRSAKVASRPSPTKAPQVSAVLSCTRPRRWVRELIRVTTESCYDYQSCQNANAPQGLGLTCCTLLCSIQYYRSGNPVRHICNANDRTAAPDAAQVKQQSPQQSFTALHFHAGER